MTDAVGTLDGSDAVIDSPTGPQPWPRAVLHGLFDALVHERDVTEPLGCSAPPSRASCPCWPTACCSPPGSPALFDHEFAVSLAAGGPGRCGSAVDGAVVEVDRPTDGPDAVAVDPLRLLDALAGRGQLDAGARRARTRGHGPRPARPKPVASGISDDHAGRRGGLRIDVGDTPGEDRPIPVRPPH